MKSLDKRLDRLESVAPTEPVMTSLGELYEWQETPEGKKELDELYNPDRKTINPAESIK